MSSAANADRFDPLPEALAARWAGFGEWDDTFFPQLVGIRLEEVRRDYARMRLPYRPELRQPAGFVHGGAIASLVDTVVVPAIAGVYEERRALLTLSMNVHYLDALRDEDAVAEGWVEQRGRSVVFCRVEVGASAGRLVATASLVYKVSSRTLA